MACHVSPPQEVEVIKTFNYTVPTKIVENEQAAYTTYMDPHQPSLTVLDHTILEPRETIKKYPSKLVIS
ncbi:hypothetical protein J4E82_006278 [Alternaria postmessia]|uniref:uncharacterized protein n=1 Tax=Alternaria postmessia TaxID=1187938 RepID=UPI0022256689|nr:uncharacterized protein J4E82_006278 [Alternaria postmessia]KAI5374978.1 hypothetical protein J4E82_006278 [Alternaria postmessia]